VVVAFSIYWLGCSDRSVRRTPVNRWDSLGTPRAGCEPSRCQQRSYRGWKSLSSKASKRSTLKASSGRDLGKSIPLVIEQEEVESRPLG
jgi:hypothetical protein